jgi:hypothetical protein
MLFPRDGREYGWIFKDEFQQDGGKTLRTFEGRTTPVNSFMISDVVDVCDDVFLEQG